MFANGPAIKRRADQTVLSFEDERSFVAVVNLIYCT
jgi:hypothetical protein